MQEGYDREKTAALIKEAREITNHLKAETEGLKRQMARMLHGGEDETVGMEEGQKALAIAAKPGWSFWR
jgi:hypothetical protein